MKNSKLFWLFLITPLFFLPACKDNHEHGHEHDHQAVNVDSVRAQIVASEAAYAAAINAGDAEAAASAYAMDAQSLADGEPTLVGRDAIKGGIQREIAADTANSTIAFETTEVWAAGNIAVETGKTMVKDSTGAVVYSGKYMALYEMRDGKYILIRDIWNSDKED